MLWTDCRAVNVDSVFVNKIRRLWIGLKRPSASLKSKLCWARLA